MPIDRPNLEPFLRHASAIRAADPATQAPVTHDIVSWERALMPSKVAMQALAECVFFLGGNLTLARKDLFRAVVSDLSPQARFLMQVMWGYLPGDGRARGRILAYFNSPVISDSRQYGDVVKCIHEGQLKEAFRRLCAVTGMSTSFATKVLYFESRHLVAPGVPMYALILDDKVAVNLVGVSSPLAGSCVMVSAPRPVKIKGKLTQLRAAWEKYWKYVDLCHEVGRATRTDADFVEYFLFTR
jgi:hypothetical protein